GTSATNLYQVAHAENGPMSLYSPTLPSPSISQDSSSKGWGIGSRSLRECARDDPSLYSEPPEGRDRCIMRAFDPSSVPDRERVHQQHHHEREHQQLGCDLNSGHHLRVRCQI